MIMYRMNCFVILPERARKVMFRLIVKFSVNANARDMIFEGVNVRNRKKRLKERSSKSAPDAPAKQNEKNFFLSPILINWELII